MLDKSSLDKGLSYDQLPDVYIIYISEPDMLETGEAVSRMKKTFGKDAKTYDDGRHVIYVNADVDDGSEVAKMMKNLLRDGRINKSLPSGRLLLMVKATCVFVISDDFSSF